MYSNADIGDRQDRLEGIADRLERYTLNSIREVLPDRVIEAQCSAAGMGYRKRCLTPVVTVLHMIMAGLWPEQSFAAAWHVHWCCAKALFGGARDKMPSLGSLCKARARVPVKAWEGILAWLCQQAQEVSKPIDSWRGHRLIVADGTTVSAPDVVELFKEFGRGHGRGGRYKYPLVRVVVLGLANTMTLVACRIGGYKVGEWSLLKQMLDVLKVGDLLIADRAFAGAHHYAAYMRRGADFVTRVHGALKVCNLEALWKLGEGGYVTRLKINKKHRREDEQLPVWVRVRLIPARLLVRGKWINTWIATSMLDELAYPATEILELYARRWRVELMLREVKVNIGADVLRSMTAEGVRKEILARLCAATIVRTLMVKAAVANGKDPLRLSFSFAVRAVVWYAPAFAKLPVWALWDKYTEMLEEIARHRVPWRPDRQEPRAVRRERKHYPTLRTTRAQWRLDNAA
jgi:hypothetical protein